MNGVHTVHENAITLDVREQLLARAAAAGGVSAPEALLRAARATIAEASRAPAVRAALGTVMLRPPQCEALARVVRHLDESGGCLLADDVGRGKTFVALAAARRWTRPLIVVPASLVDGWRLAMRQCDVDFPLLTHEALSRDGRPSFEPDGIVIDESHHFRNPATRRYARIAEVSARAELLLLSATPVQNASSDLAAQLALFLGSGAVRLGDAARARYVVRVDADDRDAGLPEVRPPRWVPLECDDGAVLHAIATLPPPPRALDAGDAGALRTMSLVRAWASSRAALAAAIARRRRTAFAIADSLDASRLPTRAELKSWRAGGDDVIQLGFASLLVAREMTDARGELSSLRREVDAELSALARLRALVNDAGGVDEARAHALALLADAHPDAKLLAFTQLAATARSYYAALKHRPGVGMLTAAGGIIASGPISRRELLVRFAPEAQGHHAPAATEQVTLLISTDLLSEGQNLQDAGIVVHLDMPWNPARLAQRVGRVRRPRGASTVRSFLIAPPASTEQLLSVETRLRRKLGEAARTLGQTLDVLPALTLAGRAEPESSGIGHAEHRSRVETRLCEWCREYSPPSPACTVIAAAVAPERGWLIALGKGRLVARIGSEVGDGAALLDRATELASGAAMRVVPEQLRAAEQSLGQFLRRERLLRACGTAVTSPDASHAQRRVAQAAASAPRHLRAACSERALRIHASLGQPMPLGAERAVLRAVANPVTVRGVSEWLAAILACIPRRVAESSRPREADRAVAIIVFGPVHFTRTPATDT